MLKLINDLLTPTSGEILINGKKPGIESKKIISYLPERTYLDKEMRVSEVLKFFVEFYDNFNFQKALQLLKTLDLDSESEISKNVEGNAGKSPAYIGDVKRCRYISS